uniref:PQ loop repeat protein n=1 Tax=Megaviridae environmental sample TaxID=1737588 RepID=A0A5J6VJ21_9VIRU|nr:MAG: hypothetical protein [Megaviridae environmental sample]
MNDELFGYIGCVFLSMLMIPQVYTTLKCRDVSSLSIGFLCLQVISSIFMLMYGIVGDYVKYPVVISNGMILLNTIILIICYKKFS